MEGAAALPRFRAPHQGIQRDFTMGGKEMRNIVHIVLPALASALQSPSPAQRFQFQEALCCVGALVR